MEYVEDTEVRGIKGYMFQAKHNSLEPPQVNPDNECFCDNRTIIDVDGSNGCMGNGLLYLQSCMGKA